MQHLRFANEVSENSYGMQFQGNAKSLPLEIKTKSASF